MTTLTKRVSRSTRGAYSVLFRRSNRIVVTMAPGDVLEFHELRRREKWSLNIDTAFKYAVRLKAFADGAAKWRAKR
jgi:hypothetical protein